MSKLIKNTIVVLSLIIFSVQNTKAEGPIFVADNQRIDLEALYEHSEVIKQNERAQTEQTLVVISATWCGPCKKFEKVANEIQRRIGVNVVIFKTNSDRADITETDSDKAEYDILFATDGRSVSSDKHAISLRFLFKKSEMAIEFANA